MIAYTRLSMSGLVRARGLKLIFRGNESNLVCVRARKSPWIETNTSLENAATSSSGLVRARGLKRNTKSVASVFSVRARKSPWIETGQRLRNSVPSFVRARKSPWIETSSPSTITTRTGQGS